MRLCDIVSIIWHFRPHRYMHSITCGLLLPLRHNRSVCLSECLPLDHTRKSYRNGCIDRGAICGMDLGGTNKPCNRWGRGLPPRRTRGNFAGMRPGSTIIVADCLPSLLMHFRISESCYNEYTYITIKIKYTSSIWRIWERGQPSHQRILKLRCRHSSTRSSFASLH